MRLTFLLLVLGMFLSCYLYPQAPTCFRVKVKGKGYLQLYSPYRYENANLAVVFSKKGDVKIQLDKPQLLFTADKNQYPIYIEPGDTINVEVFENGYTLTSDGLRKNDLLCLQELTRKLGSFQFKQISHTQGTLEVAVNEFKEHYMSFIDSFGRTLKLSPSYLSFINHHLTYLSINKVLDRISTEKHFLTLLSSKKAVIDDNLISVDEYKKFLIKYTTEISQKEGKHIIQVAAHNFSGGARDFILYYLIKKKVENRLLFKDYSTDSLYQLFTELCGNDNYKMEIDILLRQSTLANAIGHSDLLSSEESKIQSLDSVIKSFQGNYIYLDLWASWCAPCIEEMQFSKEVRQSFRNKPIIFLYVSFDKDFTAWKNRVSQIKDLMEGNNNFLLIKNFQSDFAKKYSITALPRYMLIDPFGTILLADAPRPSTLELKKMLLEELSKLATKTK